MCNSRRIKKFGDKRFQQGWEARGEYELKRYLEAVEYRNRLLVNSNIADTFKQDRERAIKDIERFLKQK